MAKKKPAAAKVKRGAKSRPSTAGDSARSSAPATSSTTGQDSDDSRAGILLNIKGLGLPTRQRPFLVEYFPTPEQARAESHVRAYELQSQRDCAERALAGVYDEWKAELAKTGQKAAINVAYRTKLGHVVAPLQYVIQVDVVHKMPERVLDAKKMFTFPSEVQGVPVKVRQIRVTSKAGTVRGMAGNVAVDAAPAAGAGPVQGGTGITSTGASNEWGTLGICLPLQQAGDLIGVTNFHVAGDPQNTVTTFPDPRRPVGTVAAPVANDILCDAASIKQDAAARFIEGVAGLEGLDGTAFRFLLNTDLENLRWLSLGTVFKAGAAMPAKATGTITNVSTNVVVENLGPGEFQQVIEVQNSENAFILSGDSGSVLVYEAQGENGTFPLVIGLNFAGSDDGKTGYAIPFGQVIDKLNLSLDPARTLSL